MLSPSIIKNQLLNIISYTNENKHLFVNNPQTDMSRQRKCPFESLVGWTLNLSSHCMNKEILGLKYALGLVYFHSNKRNFILQELYARLIMHNFTALMVACAEKKLKCSPDNKWEYRISFENAVHVSKESLKNKMINRDVINLLQRCLSIVRPDRQAPRKVKSQHALSLNNRS